MEYTKYFVAFIDILGFKRIIDNSSCDEIYKIFSEFKRQFSDIIFNGVSLVNAQDVKYKTMSDSIVFYIKDDCKNALFALLVTCSSFQANLAKRDIPILSRGGVFHGDFFIDGDIMFGPALTKAYLLESQNAKYPRIIMTHSLLQKYGNEMAQNLVWEESDGFYSVNFLKMIFAQHKTGKDLLVRFEKFIDSVLDESTDSSVREKYLYLKNCMLRAFMEVFI